MIDINKEEVRVPISNDLLLDIITRHVEENHVLCTEHNMVVEDVFEDGGFYFACLQPASRYEDEVEETENDLKNLLDTELEEEDED